MIPITCTECGAKFGGYMSFSEHRTEKSQQEPYVIYGRACLTADQLRESKRLVEDEAGVWRLPPAVTALGS